MPGKRGLGGAAGAGMAALLPSRASPPPSHSPAAAAGPPPPPWGLRPAGQAAACVSQAEDPNQVHRPYMEDGHKVVDPLLSSREDCWGLYSVFDGHGGKEETNYCVAKMHEVLAQELRALPQGKEPHDALVAAFRKVDGQLAMLGAWNSGCTATVALLHRRNGAGSRLYVANVGDSRAVLAGTSGARRLSTDHRASDAAEARRVADEGGLVRHGRVGGQLSVSRSLGDHHLKSSGVSCVPDVCACDLGAGDHALIIASDGLWDALSDSDANEMLQGCVARAAAQGGGPQGVAERLRESCARDLVKHAKEQGSRDNILALVVFF